MIAVTAAWDTLDPRRARVEVTGAPDGPVTVTRTDRNGVHLMRGMPEAIAGTALGFDHEVALTGDATYTVTGSTATLPAYAGEAGAWLAPVGAPAASVPVTVLTDSPARQSATTVLDVLDRADPVAVLRPMLTRTGALELHAVGAAAALALTELGSSTVLQLRHACADAAALDAFLVVTSATADPRVPADYAGPWTVTLEYRQVKAPAGGTAGGAWTWADVLARYTWWEAVGLTYPRWRDLLAGPNV